jgi:ABC-type transporter Mla MlaB component
MLCALGVADQGRNGPIFNGYDEDFLTSMSQIPQVVVPSMSSLIHIKAQAQAQAHALQLVKIPMNLVSLSRQSMHLSLQHF